MTKPLLFLLPGLDGTGVFMNMPANYLSDHFLTTILPYPKDAKLSYSELADYLEPNLPYGKPFYLLGESFAGPLVIELAIRRKAQVRGLILSATFSKSPAPLSFLLSPLSPFVHLELMPNFIVEQLLLGHGVSPELKNLLHQALSQANYSVLNHRIKEVMHVQDNPRIRELTMPILYLQGINDHLVPSHNYCHLKYLLPQIEHAIVQSSHVVLQTQPEYCKKVIVDFLNSHKDLVYE